MILFIVLIQAQQGDVQARGMVSVRLIRCACTILHRYIQVIYRYYFLQRANTNNQLIFLNSVKIINSNVKCIKFFDEANKLKKSDENRDVLVVHILVHLNLMYK